MKPKLFIGPMSKNIVDSVIEYSNENNIELSLIPSRRQVEHDGGYVNNWTTKNFCEYVKQNTNKVLLVRDHSGPSQGNNADDGILSFVTDCKYFDVIHIDVWKKYPDYNDGLNETIKFIELGYAINPNLHYEIGTEESIRPFSSEELDRLLTDLKNKLPSKLFSKIKYAVVQSGTALKGNTNIGKYNNGRLFEMLKVVNNHNLISKEHNGDYLESNILRDKFMIGLQSINVAPEFGKLETSIILSEIEGNEELFNKFYQICYNSKRWVKWVDSDFKPEENKKELINICGHYVFSDVGFIEIKKTLPQDIDKKIKNEIKEKIKMFLTNMEIDYYNLLHEYFNNFSNKDLVKLSKLFSSDVSLTDWEISADGIENVLKANENIFNSVDKIRVNILNIFEKNNQFSCQLEIIINDKEKIDVVDIIKFNDNNKISLIKAYKG
jgi:hypothetical protein